MKKGLRVYILVGAAIALCFTLGSAVWTIPKFFPLTGWNTQTAVTFAVFVCQTLVWGALATAAVLRIWKKGRRIVMGLQITAAVSALFLTQYELVYLYHAGASATLYDGAWYNVVTPIQQAILFFLVAALCVLSLCGRMPKKGLFPALCAVAFLTSAILPTLIVHIGYPGIHELRFWINEFLLLALHLLWNPAVLYGACVPIPKENATEQ